MNICFDKCTFFIRKYFSCIWKLVKLAQNMANPTALLLSAVTMLRHLKLQNKADRIQDAILNTIAEGKYRTADLGGSSSTTEFTNAICDHLWGMVYICLHYIAVLSLRNLCGGFPWYLFIVSLKSNKFRSYWWLWSSFIPRVLLFFNHWSFAGHTKGKLKWPCSCNQPYNVRWLRSVKFYFYENMALFFFFVPIFWSMLVFITIVCKRRKRAILLSLKLCHNCITCKLIYDMFW